MEAMRCLKRRLSDIVYQQMTTDARTATTDPGGHSGTTLQSSMTGLTPAAGSSDKPLPGSANRQPKTELPTARLDRGEP
jgi:transposase